MFQEPWFTIFLFILTPILLIGGSFVQDWLADRAAARRRARDAAAHSAE
ncbi:MAG: hypothetical protein JNJ73_01575 [Hyphomonadaceae bacterium]|nr:hypothetical protein [Hyphomonadaceae bacterium]